tara:strand:+ start:235 stop:432 length:198 start_codon:yes stop_codon:yes gene_type:complete
MTGYQSKKAMAQDKLIDDDDIQVYKRPWVGLTKEDMPDGENPMFDHEYFIKGMVFAATILKEKNT